MRRILAGIVLALVLVTAGGYALVRYGARPLLERQLQALGFEAGAIESARFGLREATFLDLRLAPGQSVERLIIGYRPTGLVRGRLESVSVEGLRLDLRVDRTGRVELAGFPAGGGGEGVTPPLLPERIEIERARAVIRTPLGEVDVEGEASIHLQPGGVATVELDVESVAGDLAGGTLSGTFEGSGRLDPFAEAPLLTLDATGNGEIAGSDLQLAGLGTISVAGPLVVDAADGELTLGSSNLTITAHSLARPDLLETLGIELPARLALGRDGAPATVTLDVRGPAVAGRLDLAAHLVAGDAEASVELEGGFRMRAEGGPAIENVSLGLELSGVGSGPTIRRASLGLEARGDLEHASATGRLSLEAAGEVGGVQAERIGLDLPLALDLDPEGLRIGLAGPGAFAGDGLIVPGTARGSARLELLPTGQPLLRLARDGRAWSLDLAAAIEALEARPEGASPVPALTVPAGRLGLALEGDGPAFGTGRIEVADLEIALPDQALALAGVDLRASFDTAGLHRGSAIPLTVGSLRSTATPALFTPLEISGALEPAADRVDFSGTATGAGGALQLGFEGRHRLDQGRGRAALELAPLRFVPGGLQPAGLVPRARGLVQEVSGEVSLSGPLAWDGAGLQSDLEVQIRELGLVAGPAVVQGVNGVVVLDGLVPPSTPPHQQLRIGLVDVGLAFTDGRTTFELLPGGPLDVRRLRFDWAGGQIVAGRFTVGSADDVLDVGLEARGLDLDAIFGHVKLPGLTGQGTIDGTLPLRIDDGEAVIEGGELKARRPGWLRYRPDGTPGAVAAGGESMTLLLQALENFRYDELRITLDGRTDRAMDIGLHLKGANPDLYDGHPIEFNLNLEGELANILEQGLRSYTLPDRVRERIEQDRRR